MGRRTVDDNKEIEIHEKYMRRALDLALLGKGKTNPNPMVGAVIVKNDKIISEGYHRGYGRPHAEIEALKNSKRDVAGSTMYVNLEPCCHYGKTPPCVKAIIDSRINKIYIGMLDPNPQVKGKGMKILRDAGIDVTAGILRKEAIALNLPFVKYITSNIPFVILKSAASLDGKIATNAGESKWITGKLAREYVHEKRFESDAIIVGIETVLKDDPKLTARRNGKIIKEPLRVILDSKLRIPENAKILQDDQAKKTFIATTSSARKSKIKVLKKKGAEIFITQSNAEGRVLLEPLIRKLGNKGISQVIIEGGGEVNASALEEGIVDKVILFYAPIIIGGKKSPSVVGGNGIKRLDKAIRINNVKVTQLGYDIMIEGFVKQRTWLEKYVYRNN